jgi:DNA-binding transcriptional MocR family regulator
MDLDPSAASSLLGGWAVPDKMLGVALADRIGQLVAEGQVPPGTRLPSTRSMGSALSISRTTVGAAHETLRAQGTLDSSRRACDPSAATGDWSFSDCGPAWMGCRTG